MNVAVIPARAGSKRVKGKNIRDFCGKPIIAYSIEAAKASQVFDRILVSTDDDTIAAISEKHGAEAPFRRPGRLADDRTPTVPVIRHAVEWLRDTGSPTEFVCCIYATAPMVTPEDVVAGLNALRTSSDTHFAYSVTRFAYPIDRALKIEGDRVSMIWAENEIARSQDLRAAYHDAGQFYWGRPESWVSRDSILCSESVPVLIPSYRVQDIDTEEDWRRAEFMFQAIRKSPDE